MKKIQNIMIIIGIIYLIFIIGCSGATTESNEDNEKEVKKDNVELTITAKELSDKYKENELRADEKYKDKIIEVSGVIDSISKVFGQTSIGLASNDLFGVNCMFESKYESKIAKLNKGDKITIIGHVNRYGITVDISKCIIKE